MQKTFLFDFDGTLVDSMPTFAKIMLKILKENNIKYNSDIIKIITPLGYNGTAEYFCKLGIKKSPEELVKIMKNYALQEYLYKFFPCSFIICFSPNGSITF